MMTIRRHRYAWMGLLGLTLGAATPMLAMATQDTPPEAASPPQAGMNDFGAMLAQGLRSSEGCLGVDLGTFQSGRQSVFAWFEDNAAVKRWYYSRTHQSMMGMVLQGEQPPRPLEHVEDDGPMLVIASITPSPQPSIEGVPLPIEQISIELFRAAPGGAHINGRLSPATFAVPHMKDYAEAGADDADSR